MVGEHAFPLNEPNVLIRCTFTAVLICFFVFSYVCSRLSHDVAYIELCSLVLNLTTKIKMLVCDEITISFRLDCKT